MRDIFRGLPLNGDGKYVYGSLVKIDSRCFILEENASTKPVHRILNHLLEVDPATVGQYIGLEDIHGDEIYAGMTVKWGHHPKNIEAPHRIAKVVLNPDIQFHSQIGIFKYGNFGYWETHKYLEIIEDEASHDDKRKDG